MMGSNAIKIVELTGTPGSGKSTLEKSLSSSSHFISAARLQEQLCLQYWAGRQAKRFLPEPLERRFQDLLFQPKLTASFDELLSRRPDLHQVIREAAEASGDFSPQFRSKMVFWTLRSHALQEIAREILPAKSYFIHDEGTVHRLTTLFAGSQNWRGRQREVHRYLEHIQWLKTLIIVDAPNEICIRRMRRRRAGIPLRFQDASDQEISRFLDSCREISLYAGQLLTERGVQVLKVNTEDKSPKEIRQELKKKLKKNKKNKKNKKKINREFPS